MNCWVIECSNSDLIEGLDDLHLTQLHKNNSGWSVSVSGRWKDIHGSSDFLLSLALPETEIFCVVHPFASETVRLDHLRQVWLSSTSHSIQVAPYLPWHSDLVKQLSEHGKSIRFVAAQNSIEAPASSAFVQCKTWEALYLIQSQSETDTPPSLTIKLSRKLIQHDRRFHTALLGLCLTTCFAVWHLLPIWLNYEVDHAKSGWMNRQQQKSLPSTSPDWRGAHEKLHKFGTDNRANLSSITLRWNRTGEIRTLIELNRPRKRLPKGCIYQQGLKVECPIIPPLHTAGS